MSYRTGIFRLKAEATSIRVKAAAMSRLQADASRKGLIMTRRDWLKSLFLAPAALASCAETPHADEAVAPEATLKKSEAEWRALLSPAAYAVLFEADTEPAGSSPLNGEKREGVYVCAACFLPLFDSRTKFESGTGWPSFYQPIAGATGSTLDFKLIVPRTEYHCIRCGGHQGHVFTDGPPPTGQRWCNNGLALNFVPAGQPLPPLRA